MERSDVELLNRAKAVIPWGTQTNAKRPVEAFAGAMPFFIERAKGCRIWGLDGREFIDYRCSLGPINLGYANEEVDTAVRKQMESGVLFSMASPIEVELAEFMTQIVPGCEAVRFLKTGGGACSAAVRLARAFTGREKIISIGYHGWHDTFWAAHNDPGVPKILSELMWDVALGDIARVEEIVAAHHAEIAAIITIPYDWNDTPNGAFLQKLRQLCDKYEIVLIFDEVLTGFRLALGGAAEYFNVKPDMAVFAKALANGYPLSAFTGRKDIMHKALEKTFITATHAGETLSIAAALTTLHILQREPVYEQITETGTALMTGITEIAQKYGLPLTVKGLPCGFNLVPNPENTAVDTQLITRFEEEIFKQNLFIYRIIYVNYAHKMADIELTLKRLDAAAKAAVA